MPQRKSTPRSFAANFHFLGQVDYEECLTAQKRIGYDALSREDGRLVVLVCEHAPLITIGRRGSRDQLQFTGAELAERELAVRYVARGGGCLLHGPGQLAIYVCLQLSWHGWSVGEYLRRLQAGLQRALTQLGVTTKVISGHFGLWGQAGLIAAIGCAVRYGVISQGAFLGLSGDWRNASRVGVLPDVEYDALTSAEHGDQPWPKRPVQSSLEAETSLCDWATPAKMSQVRIALVAQLAEAFGCSQPQLHTGHPLLPELTGSLRRESAA